jgi:DNA repair protein RadC
MYNFPIVKISYANEGAIWKPTKVTGSHQAYEYLRSLYEPGQLGHIERFFMLLLNRNNMILGAHLVSVGGVAGTVVDPKIIFQTALLANASAIVLCHNHPSGNIMPSQQDVDITNKIKAGAKFLDISVSDHIIIAPQGEYYSFADHGHM